MVNRVPELLAEKFGGADKVNKQQVAQDMRVTYSVVLRWNKRDIHMIDAGILEKWCEYFKVGVGEILEYVPVDKQLGKGGREIPPDYEN